MELTILGFKINVLNAVIFLALGFLIATMTVASCSKVSVKEAFTNFHNAASVTGDQNDELLNSWTSRARAYAGNVGQSTKQKPSYKGTPVPLKEGQLSIFADNKFRPECCPSTYSSSTGCACVSQEQIKYLSERAGNRTMTSEF
jgi:hypothetical protein